MSNAQKNNISSKLAKKNPPKKRNNNNKRFPMPKRTFNQGPIGFNPVTLRNNSVASGVRVLQQFHRQQRAKYITGLLHPDYAVQTGMNLKLYSDIPTPSSSFGVHVQQSFSTNALGNGLWSWRPNLLVNSGHNQCNVTWNNAVGLTGGASVAGNNFAAAGNYRMPTGTVQKYRLVSALAKVSYNGNVLNQAGTMIGSITTDNFLVGASTVADPAVDRFGDFSLIEQGLWNQEMNITENSQGLEFLYIPMDPNAYIYHSIDTYYGNALTSPGPAALTVDMAILNYVCAIRAGPASTQCIRVDYYYNFEIMADPTAAPYLGGKSAYSPNASEHAEIVDHIQPLAHKIMVRPAVKTRAKVSSFETMFNNIQGLYETAKPVTSLVLDALKFLK